MSLRWDKFAQSVSNRHLRHSKTEPITAQLNRTETLVFETLEPRLLLAADPLGITAGYAFNELSGTTAADSSGNGFTGALVNGPTFTVDGKYANAIALDGLNDYVDLGNPAALQLTGSMTVSAWIYASAFPVDDAAIVSKRAAGESGFQLDTTVDQGPRTIGFKLTTGSGGQMFRYGATTLQANTWYYVTGVYDAAAQTLDVYLNGQLDNGALIGTVSSSQQNSTANVIIGRRSGLSGFEFNGRIDDVRIANHALTQDQIQTDMITPLPAGTPNSDTVAPTISLTGPAPGIVSGTVTVSAVASDNVGVSGVQFLLDGAVLGAEDGTSPYSVTWNTATATNGTHILSARARDAVGNTTLAQNISVTVSNSVDNQAPTGSVVINGGATATKSRSATLTLSASDPSGVTQMRFSNSGTSFSAAEPYTATKVWTLSSGAGTKTVYVQFKDAAGNWSSLPISDSIVLDTTAPTISARTATNITNNTTTINWTTSEPATTRVEYGLTTSYGSTTVLDPNLTSTHSVLLTGLAANTTYNYRVRSIDAAGNERVSTNGSFKTAAGADTTAPIVQSISRAAASPTNAASVSWTVLFSETVTGVDTGDFALVSIGGVTGATITSVSGTGGQYSVFATTGSGSGTIGLNLSDNDTIADASANRLGGTGAGNGSFTGQIYTVDKAAPAVTINQAASQADPTSTGPVNFTVNFSEAVTGFGANDIAFAGTTAGGTLSAAVTGGGANYNVAVSGMTTAGSIVAQVVAGAAVDIAGNASGASTSADNTVAYNVSGTGFFQNQILATGLDLPTAMTFLPDGRMLVAELAGTINVLQTPYTTVDPVPFLQLSNVGSAGVQQGIYDIKLDPNFATNRYYYVSYTAGTPNHDRLSRFTANATLTGTISGSELIIYEDSKDADAEHHGGAINFGNDGKIYFTTGEHFEGTPAQDLTSPRGKVLRFNPDGTIPTDNPFYDGAGPNYDAVWAYGLRNPYRAYYDAPTGRLLIGDVGGNNYSTAIEELNVGIRGANYGWPNVEGISNNPAYTNPIYSYAHLGRDAAITGGFVYHGSQFPSSYQGSYFFADYSQNWIKRLTFDANGNVNGVFNFEPANGAADGATGDIVYLTEGPDGALYYIDLGYSDTTFTAGISKIRRISYVNTDAPPIVAAAATTATQGPAPLTVSFSSQGSADPEGRPLSYAWNFGDGSTSTAANPTHTYTVAGPYQARLTVFDGVSSTISNAIGISVGIPPVVAPVTLTNSNPAAAPGFFRAGDMISYGATATDPDGTLPASSYSWTIDFLHEGHIHPSTPVVGVTGGTFTIPTAGHDYSGNTRYRVTLTVTDADGLQSTQSALIYPEKVNLSFDTTPPGLTLYLDGIAHTGPFVYDALIGFNHTIEARNQTIGANTYNFASWSDGGAQQHVIVAPVSPLQPYTASYSVVTAPVTLAFVQVSAATPQTNQSSVSVVYTGGQTAGNTNILAIGWNNATSNITSVTDSAGNVYELAVPTARGSGISQAIYYAKNIKAAPAATNIVTVTFDTSTPYVDIRATEYSGLDPINPFDVGSSGSGTSATASSGSVTTTAANELIFGAGITTGGFTGSGAGFTTRIITNPDLDIVEDRFVTSSGLYSATAPLGTAAWVMQVATFRAATGQA